MAFRQSDQYGNSWIVSINDIGEHFALQLQEQSRICTDFLKKLPNLRCGIEYEFTPYDFEKDGKRRSGISIKKGQEKIGNFYQEFSEIDGKMNVKNLYGFPPFDCDPKDKDELKIYFLKVTKFLRNATMQFLKSKFQDSPVEPTVEEEPPPEVDPHDDLPF